jgi:hypothetical protein
VSKTLSYILIILDLSAVLSVKAIQTTLLSSVKALYSTDNIHRLVIKSQSA